MLEILIILIVVALVAFFLLRAATSKHRITKADHYHWIVRSLAALLAVSAVVATAICTWRGTSVAEDSRPFSVRIPTRPPPPLPQTKRGESISLGNEKLIGTVIVARWVGGRLIPISGESKVCDSQSKPPWRMEFSGQWQDADYQLGIDLDRFELHGEDKLHPQGSFTFKAKGPTWSRSTGGSSHPIGMLSVFQMTSSNAELRNAPLSVVPAGEKENVYVLFHLERADAGDALTEVTAEQWLEGKSTTHLAFELGQGNEGAKSSKATIPGIRMLAYLGPSAFLLLLAAGAGSLCFRYGWRAPAIAALTAAMVIYAGSLDAMVLHRRAGVMTDATQSESNRLHAMSAIPSTFFHAKRAASVIAEATREGRIRPSVRRSLQ